MPRPIRVLTAWFEDHEALGGMIGRMPNPGEDVSPYLTEFQAKRATLAARAAFSIPTPTLEPLPEQLAQRGIDFLQRADVQMMFASLQYEIGVANLEQIISYQKQISLEQIEERIGSVNQSDWDQLFSICLPDVGPPEHIETRIDNIGKAVAFSSKNVNLRFQGFMLQDQMIMTPTNQPGFAVKGYTFQVGILPSFVQVTELNGRWFLRDGYHRCFGLLQRGITRVPCLFIRARNFTETGAEQPVFVRRETLFGERPPLFKDFLDDSVSSTCQHQSLLKIIRINVDEFAVSRD